MGEVPIRDLRTALARPRFLPWQQVLADPADPGLADELRELVPDTTDDMDDPWERVARR